MLVATSLAAHSFGIGLRQQSWDRFAVVSWLEDKKQPRDSPDSLDDEGLGTVERMS